MTPDSVKRAAETLASNVTTRIEARSDGAALGKTLAAQARGREVATEQINGAHAIKIEMALIQLAASENEFLAEVAHSALDAWRLSQKSRA